MQTTLRVIAAVPDTNLKYTPEAKSKTALERARALSDEKLLNIIDMFGIIKMPGYSFLALAIKHSVHHRGQLSTYLRPMGGKVPGIYGPTADSH